jgi:thioesterase domain-containing protein
VLFDSWPRAYFTEQIDDSAIVYGFAKELAARSRKQLPMTYEDVRKVEPDRRLSYVVDQLKSVQMIGDDTGLPLVRRFVDGFYTRDRIWRQYRPGPCGGRILLFHSREAELDIGAVSADGSVDLKQPDYGWGRIAGAPIEFEWVPGSHSTSLIEPHVAIVAERLARQLDGVQPAASSTACERPAALA